MKKKTRRKKFIIDIDAILFGHELANLPIHEEIIRKEELSKGDGTSPDSTKNRGLHQNGHSRRSNQRKDNPG